MTVPTGSLHGLRKILFKEKRLRSQHGELETLHGCETAPATTSDSSSGENKGWLGALFRHKVQPTKASSPVAKVLLADEYKTAPVKLQDSLPSIPEISASSNGRQQGPVKVAEGRKSSLFGLFIFTFLVATAWLLMSNAHSSFLPVFGGAGSQHITILFKRMDADSSEGFA